MTGQVMHIDGGAKRASREGMTGTLRPCPGDQLSLDLSSLKDADKKTDIILMCEVWDEATYVKHHKKKIAFLFSAMRHFAADLAKAGYQVDYISLDDPSNTQSFKGETRRAIKRHNAGQVVVTYPGEYRVLKDMQTWADEFAIPVDIRENDRFLCRIDEFKSWAEGRKSLRMEFFYRDMRRKHKILLQKNGDPEGGEWNYDSENRSFPKMTQAVPAPSEFKPDEITRDVLKLVARNSKVTSAIWNLLVLP
jgi:deoxyribodipyrimidine photolyase-related protein